MDNEIVSYLHDRNANLDSGFLKNGNARALFLTSLAHLRVDVSARSYAKAYVWLANVILAHVMLMVINMTAMLVMMVMAPWYIAYPLITLLVSPGLGQNYCILNLAENRAREKLRMKQIPFLTFKTSLDFFTGKDD